MKFKYTVFTVLCLILAPVISAQSIEQKILSQYFPKFNKANQCWVATSEQGSYCLKLDSSKTVDTPRGKELYMLAAGDHFDFAANEADGAHVHSGYVAMFVASLSDNKWKILSSKVDIPVGAFGHAPTGWSFHQFGPQTYGFLNEHGDVHQGYAGSHYVILTPNGKGIKEHWIGATVSNEGAVEDASRTESVTSKIKIDRTKPITSGLYPLNITLNGKMGKTKLSNKTYVIPYDINKKTYVSPKNYPLREIDY